MEDQNFPIPTLSYKLSSKEDWERIELDESDNVIEALGDKIAELEQNPQFENLSITFFLDDEDAWKHRQCQTALNKLKNILNLQGQVRTFDDKKTVKYSHVLRQTQAYDLAKELFSL